jgi:hypothetical protein
MISRSALSGGLGLVLLASLGLKLQHDPDNLAPNAGAISARMTALLERRGLAVTHGDDDQIALIGTAGACHVVLTEVAPQGWQRFVVTGAAGNDHLLYLFAGRVYTKQPVLRTRAQFYWHKLQRYFGVDGQDSPVLAVVFTRACVDLPLQDLAAVTR